MLAVQRPSMGSSKPPNPELPFGYSFDDQSTNFPFPSPTPPAPGPSLLDDNESKFLDSFFDGVSADNFNYDFLSNAPDGSELGLGWEELPPTFMGTTSSFGQQSHIASNGLSDASFNDIHPHLSTAESSIQPSASADVLAAATLLQNGSTGRSHSIGNEALFQNQASQLQSSNGQMRAQSMSQYQPARSDTMQERPTSDDFMRDTTWTDMMFGNPNPPSRPRATNANAKTDIRWGSDVGFGAPQGFIPPTSQEKVSALEQYHIKAVATAFLGINPQQAGSADTTRPSSPVLSHSITPQSGTKSTSRAKDDGEQSSRPRKRRKGKIQEEVDDNDQYESPTPATNKASGKKRKPTKTASSSHDSPTPSEQSHKRSKSTATANTNAAATKNARENLTEDQKRENHIKSEQKRRTLIREGFDDLGELVPGLRDGGFSKSAVLIMAADWLEDLIRGNEVLRRRLDSMQNT